MACAVTLSRKTARSASVGLASTSMMNCFSSVWLAPVRLAPVCFASFAWELVPSSSSSLSLAEFADNRRWRTISPNCGVEVTTTICWALSPIVASLAGNIISAVMMAGASKVSTTKEVVRTRSMYSRWMISHVLRIGVTHGYYAWGLGLLTDSMKISSSEGCITSNRSTLAFEHAKRRSSCVSAPGASRTST